MSVIKKAVIVVHRPESARDFLEIKRRVHKLDPSIGVSMVPDYVTSKMVPPEFLQVPLLVVYLVNPPPTNFTKAAKVAVRATGKIEEYECFLSRGLPCLPIQRFEWGMELDPDVYGDWVVLKPESIQSTGRDVNLVPTLLVPKVRIEDFPEDHLIRKDSYLIQRFVKSGEHPDHYRVMVFLDEILYSKRSISNISYPPTTANLSEFLSTTVASNSSDRVVDYYKDDEVNELALRVARSFPENPLFGIDILREEGTGRLYVLEVNLGGNVWHFSSKLSVDRRGHLTAAQRKAFLEQYNAWDRAAEALIRKTHELAK